LLQKDDRETEGEAETSPDAPLSHDMAADRISDTDATEAMDADHSDLYSDSSPGERSSGEGAEAAQAGGQIDWSRAGSGGSFDADGDFESLLTKEKTLNEHLEDQMHMARLDGPDRAIGAVLIDSVDEGGYLRADLADLANRLGCDLPRVEAVLARLQGFEPTGVFARDVRECLMLQLKEKNRFDPAMATLLDHLDLVARRDMASLRHICQVDDEDLRDMIAELRALTSARQVSASLSRSAPQERGKQS
jgi:RNA polymerase sigma-54 factor